MLDILRFKKKTSSDIDFKHLVFISLKVQRLQLLFSPYASIFFRLSEVITPFKF